MRKLAIYKQTHRQTHIGVQRAAPANKKLAVHCTTVKDVKLAFPQMSENLNNNFLNINLQETSKRRNHSKFTLITTWATCQY